MNRNRETLQVSINGNIYKFPEGITILDALRQVNIKIPTLCYDKRLKPYGSCRLCIVKVEGFQKPITSCSTKISDDMIIETHSEEIEKRRRTSLRLLARH